MTQETMTHEDDFAGKEIYEFKFPDELYGVIIDGIDVTILSLDSIRLIEAYAKQGGDLSDVQWQVLRQCRAEVQAIIPKLDGLAQKYFQRICGSIQDVMKRSQSET